MIALRESHRVLKAGGLIAISMKAGNREEFVTGGSVLGSRWQTLIQPDDLLGELRRAGFTECAYTWSGRKNWFVASARKPYSSAEEPT